MTNTAPSTAGAHTAPGAGDFAARTQRIAKVYGRGDAQVVALDGVTVGIPRGRFTAIMGPSGSGKSTLMHCMAGLDSVDSGEVFIGDTELTRLKDKQLTRLRRDKVGFIFQAFNLVPTLTALENITLPMDIAGRKPDKEWLDTVIDTVDLRPRLKHRPSELSGGQQQRVACARALAARPEIIFADEPTGNLDSRSGAEVLGFLRDSVRRMGQTIVMVTHDPSAAAYADQVLFLTDGQIVDTMEGPTAERVLERMKGFDTGAGRAAQPASAQPAGRPGGQGPGVAAR
ncbi:ABC transporter ATP-binding protein [Actinomadura sp. KC06]|uniref:ABC transporter ATP-binding protein n=1 Tax=Actinomadura sp. KC06 TaxID=2530369 RepID=UPI001043FDB4|nr:ABC transporter ATP-binding protein [Actinomadura sp. KC06]TDD28152.1 ABC transporter ATP-binding protein [Actinomadura sp. KC06]